jgi:DtxR family Mn-dependent transcriptional regulator
MNIDRFEEYLETILYLIRKNKGPAKTKQISEELNVSPPSVTEMIKKIIFLGTCRVYTLSRSRIDRKRN